MFFKFLKRKILRHLLLICLLFIFHKNVNSLSIPVVSDIQDVISLANDLQGIMSGNIPFKQLFTKVENPITQTLEKLDGITQQISALSGEISERLDTLTATLLEQLPLQNEISTTMREFNSAILRIDELYDDFQSFVDAPSEFNDDTLETFVASVVSNAYGDLPNVLTQMKGLFVPSRAGNIRETLMQLLIKADDLTTPAQRCLETTSLQERMYEIFNIITASELRGFVMTLFAYQVKSATKNSSYTREVQKATAKYVMRSEEYILTTQKKLSACRRDTYRCDPPKQVRDETFVELQRSISGFVIPEEFVFSGSCQNKCDEIDTVPSASCIKRNDGYCPNHPCPGRAYSCHSLEGVVTCEYPQSYTKRYKWIDSDAKKRYGPGGSCDNGASTKTVNAYTPSFWYCDNCFCRCIETLAKSKGIRAISFMDQGSHISDNKVVTNMRFIEKGKMIHLMVEETPLLPQGRVDRNHSRWLSAGTYEYKQEGENGAFYSTSWRGDVSKMEWGVDFTFITDKQRTFNLDLIQLPPDYVLTGIRMNHAKPKNINSAIWIELQGTPFDFASGKLNPTDEKPSKWFTPRSQPNPPAFYSSKRSPLDLGSRYDPLTLSKNSPMSKPCTYVEFIESNIEQDAAQSTVPFFDAQPVTINRTLAITGVETFWKGAPNYGGYIALKVYNLDLSRYMDSIMKKNQVKAMKKLYRQPLAFDIPQKK